MKYAAINWFYLLNASVVPTTLNLCTIVKPLFAELSRSSAHIWLTRNCTYNSDAVVGKGD